MDFGFLGSWRQRPRLRPPGLPAADDIPVPTVSTSFPRDRQRRLILGATEILS